VVSANIEIKARVARYDHLQRAVAALSDTPATRLDQEDTFFQTQRGRLKLRTYSHTHGELIYYERADTPGPKPSHYSIIATPEPAALKALLAAALGVRGVVRKQRILYTVGQTRVHLDTVTGLGRFVELEWVMGAGQTVAEGHQAVTELMQRLAILPADLITGAYIDMLVPL
jgi:predicted adenylyl cyclase CyaB